MTHPGAPLTKRTFPADEGLLVLASFSYEFCFRSYKIAVVN